LYAFIIITNKLTFANAVKEYFVSMSPINFNNTKIFVFGLDTNSETEIIEDLKKVIVMNEKIENGFIFSDFGDSVFSSKIIENLIENMYYSKGSLIESGFLAFTLINGGAPIESIMLAIDREVKK
jgi:dihydroxyacetone kinase DhaKLM complex PTS-EIIA-like component DhaM